MLLRQKLTKLNSSRTEKKVLRTKFFIRKLIIQQSLDDHKIDTVFDFFLSQIFTELFDELGKKSPDRLQRC